MHLKMLQFARQQRCPTNHKLQVLTENIGHLCRMGSCNTHTNNTNELTVGWACGFPATVVAPTPWTRANPKSGPRANHDALAIAVTISSSKP